MRIGASAAPRRHATSGSARSPSSPNRSSSVRSRPRSSVGSPPRQRGNRTTTSEPVGALRIEAPAKVNLYLHVTGRRADGYHLLDSLIAFAAIGDTLDIEESDELSLVNAGPFGVVL